MTPEELQMLRADLIVYETNCAHLAGERLARWARTIRRLTGPTGPDPAAPVESLPVKMSLDPGDNRVFLLNKAGRRRTALIVGQGKGDIVRLKPRSEHLLPEWAQFWAWLS